MNFFCFWPIFPLLPLSLSISLRYSYFFPSLTHTQFIYSLFRLFLKRKYNLWSISILVEWLHINHKWKGYKRLFDSIDNITTEFRCFWNDTKWHLCCAEKKTDGWCRDEDVMGAEDGYMKHVVLGSVDFYGFWA